MLQSDPRDTLDLCNTGVFMNRSDTQNVTVTLPSDLLREARHLAVDQGVSLSRFLAMMIEEKVAKSRRYRVAEARQRRILEEGLPLGTQGAINWSRDELHER